MLQSFYLNNVSKKEENVKEGEESEEAIELCMELLKLLVVTLQRSRHQSF